MAENGLSTIIRMTADACAQEPIHLPGSIQPHGAIVALDPRDLSLLAHSANKAEIMPTSAEKQPADWLPGTIQTLCRQLTPDAPTRSAMGLLPDIGRTEIHCFLAQDTVFIEFECGQPSLAADVEETQTLDTRDWIRRLHGAADLEQLSQILAQAVGSFSGFERILVYKFDEQDDGDVVGEYLVPEWDQSLMGFHFPSSDIPPQARALYLRSAERWLPSRDYDPVPLVPAQHPATGKPFDLGLSGLRSISPMHQIYQRNLGVDGSMSISITHEGRLWGLLVGHHRRPHRVGSAIRCHVASLTEAFALRLGTLHANQDMDALLKHTTTRARIICKLAGADDFVSALTEGELRANELFPGCSGVAVIHLDAERNQAVSRLGSTPPEADILQLMTWLRAYQEDIFVTDCILGVYPAFAAHKDVASGVMAIFLGETRSQAVLWFRPQVVTSITWGGRPEKRFDPTENSYLPRQSFDRWVEQKFGHSQPWHKWELSVARTLGTTLNAVIMRQMRRIQQLDAEVQRFLWVTSHDLREPLRAVNIYTELLERNYAPLLDERGLQFIGFARQGAVVMDKRLRGLAAYAQIGQNDQPFKPFSLTQMIQDIQAGLGKDLADCSGQLRVLDTLPDVLGDPSSLHSVFDNLIANALTFHAPDQAPDIRIWAEPLGDKWQIAVADNGIGIPPEHHQRVFEMYQRLQVNQERGPGLGLTICRRIIEHHGGRIWLNSKLGRGTTVYFTLPRASGERHPAPSCEPQSITPNILREAVREHHGRIEQTALMLPLASGRVTADEYCRALAALYGFYRPLEEFLFSQQPNLATDMGVRPKLPALIKDLGALGLSERELADLPLAPPVTAEQGQAEQIGMLYVLEGATLGGQVVRKRIAHSLGALAELTTAFHGFHGDQVGPWWKQFQSEIISRLDDNPAAIQQTVLSALATFEGLEAWLVSRS